LGTRISASASCEGRQRGRGPGRDAGRRREGAMRVLINGLAAAGPRTGIGHYAGELVRCLRELAGEAAVDVFEPRWMRRGKSLLGRLRRRAERPAPGGPPRPGWRAGLLDGVRRAGLGVYRWRFRGASRRG